MAGCAKAGRNKKSASNTAYVNGKRQETNRKRNMAKHAKACEAAKTKEKTPRGTARAQRRLAAANSGITGKDFPSVWKHFCKLERGEFPAESE